MKHLYIETDSLELEKSCQTGWLRVIIGDAQDVDVRASQYKGKRRQDFFGTFSIPGRDHEVHSSLKRVKNTSYVRYIPPTEDVQSVEVFEFKVDPLASDEVKKLTAVDLLANVVQEIGGEVESFSFIPTSWQRKSIEFVANSLSSGKTTLMLELAARFGKTGTLLLLFDYSDAKVLVVANYFKSVNTSFADTILRSFADRMRWLDIAEDDFSEKLDGYLTQGFKVVIGAALHNKAQLSKRIEKISSVPDRIVVVDEADFGSHTKAQFDKVSALRVDSPLLLMTGTNADRAVSKHKIDASLSITYFDMLLMSSQTTEQNK